MKKKYTPIGAAKATATRERRATMVNCIFAVFETQRMIWRSMEWVVRRQMVKAGYKKKK